MATVGIQRRLPTHEDDLRTEDTQVMDEEEDQEESDDQDMRPEECNEDDDDEDNKEDEDDDEEDDGEGDADDSDYDDADVGDSVKEDMEDLQNNFPGFRGNYRLLKRIGEGTFSTVYKAEDLAYDRFDNYWDTLNNNSKDLSPNWTPPPIKSQSQTQVQTSFSHPPPRKHFVAIKKIYATSSPARILNELALLSDLREFPSVCPLITAFRQADQVVAILPYFRHDDFRRYFRDMTVSDTRIYLRSLFTALAAVHEKRILHRDIKPTNFLYDPTIKSGRLVDFGLAEREGVDTKPCLCHEPPEERKARVKASVAAMNFSEGMKTGYPKNDTRPSRRANRAGTRGFRAPEVLFKCTEQSTKIDIWSAGVILLTIMSKRFPFFNSADDVDAMIEMAHIFGSRKMRLAGLIHGCMFETDLPTITSTGFSLEKIILWSTARDGQDGIPLTEDEQLAVKFLGRCLELDPSKRLSAKEALEHEFLREPVSESEDEMSIVQV